MTNKMPAAFCVKNSKQGVTLVEVICAVFLLAVVVIAAITAINFAQQNITSYNTREQASAKAESAADALLTQLSKSQVDLTSAAVIQSLESAAGATYRTEAAGFSYEEGKDAQFQVKQATQQDGNVTVVFYYIEVAVFYQNGESSVGLNATATVNGLLK